jgi:hypothetical protein
MEFVNCTPHRIVVNVDGTEQAFEPSGILPRIETIETPAVEIEGIPTITVTRGKVENLPVAEEGVVLIVSGMVLAGTDRLDIVAPDTGKTAIRKDGRIVAVRRFIRN